MGRPKITDTRRAPARRVPAGWRRLWPATIAVGVLLCVAATFALLSPTSESSAAGPSPAIPSTVIAPTSVQQQPLSNATSPHLQTEDPSGQPDLATRTSSTAPSASESRPDPLTGVPVSIGLTTGAIPVVPIGVTPDGVLVPPDDIATAGWWVAGPRIGAPGRTVITGHIDSRAGLGAFAALDGLHEGDTFTVTTADARTVTYVVTDRDEVQKTALDPATLIGSGGSDLLLVTCIGVFDTDTRHYESNLLITAVQDQS